jgi:FAD/FMN-containing dehydrogenase
LRGGGGGNVGIVTSLSFDTVPAPQLTAYALAFPAGSVAQRYDPNRVFTFPQGITNS